MLNPLFDWAIFGVTISKFELLAIGKGFDGVAILIFVIYVELKNDGACIWNSCVVQLRLDLGQNVCDLSVMGRVQMIFL